MGARVPVDDEVVQLAAQLNQARTDVHKLTERVSIAERVAADAREAHRGAEQVAARARTAMAQMQSARDAEREAHRQLLSKQRATIASLEARVLALSAHNDALSLRLSKTTQSPTH